MINIEKIDRIPDDIKNDDILIRLTISKNNKCCLWWSNQLRLEQTLSIIYWEITLVSVKSGINIFHGTNN